MTIETGAIFLRGEDSTCLVANPRLSPFLPKGEGGGGGDYESRLRRNNPPH